MTKNRKESKEDKLNETSQLRRDFLRKSKYAVYAAPLMTSLIISQNAAATSHGLPTDPR